MPLPTMQAADLARLGTDMLQFARDATKMQTCAEVLDGLHKVTSPFKINVLCAALMPIRRGDWSSLELNRTVFLHKSVPAGWWDEWRELNLSQTGPMLVLTQMALAPFSVSEVMTQLEPLGVERSSLELALKYGMRDGLTCPVGGRWMLTYWSPHVLPAHPEDEARAMLLMGATFAVLRLQKIMGPQVSRLPRAVALTPRELSVMRLLSNGCQFNECAKLLGLGTETFRSHLKKAQSKLGVRSR